MDNRTKEHMRRMLEQRWEISRHDGGRAAQRGSGGAVRKPVRGGLCVSIYQQLVKRNPATQGMAGFISLGLLLRYCN